MSEIDKRSLKTVSKVLWAWSDGDISSAEAIEILHLEDELLESARGSEGPIPQENPARHRALADEFVQKMR